MKIDNYVANKGHMIDKRPKSKSSAVNRFST